MNEMLHQRRRKWPLRPSFCLLFVLLCLAGRPTSVQAQIEKLTDPVTLQARNIPLSQLVMQIKQQTSSYMFSYSENQLARIIIQEVNWKKMPLGKVLQELAHLANLQYTVLDKNIGIIVEKGKSGVQEKTGLLRGRVVDFETAQPLSGATVQLLNSSFGVVTDKEGYYRLTGVPAGTYTLLVSFIGYQHNMQTGVKIEENRSNSYDVKMQTGVSQGAMKEVVVDGRRQRISAVTYSTDAQLISEVRNSRAVVSGISNEQILKTADRNAAEIVKRISGVTVVDDKFIVVRGMNQRYNLTYLNDNLAPATEMYNRAFAYDLLPSPVIDRILVYKSPSAELLGDYAGGAIKVFTKNARPVRHFDLGFQTGYRAGTTGSTLNAYKGGGLDWLGFDDGTRKMPGIPGYRESGGKNTMTQENMVNAFTNTWTYHRSQVMPDMQFFVNYFDNWRIGKYRLYNLTSLTYTHENRRWIQDRQTGNTYAYRLDKYGYNVGGQNSLITDDQSHSIAKLNLLQNFTLKIDDNNRLEFKNFILNDGRDMVVVRTSHANVFPDIWESTAYDRRENKQNTFTWQQRFLYNGNLGGNHSFGKKTQELHWNLGYSFSRQDVPDQRITNFFRVERKIQSATGSNYYDADERDLRWQNDYESPQSLSFGMMSRLFVRNNENLYNASLDYIWKPTPQWQLKAGTYQLFRTREVDRRYFKVLPAGLTGNETSFAFNGGGRDNNGAISPELILFREQDLPSIWSATNFKQNGTGLWIYDVANPTDRYVATEQNNSGYLQGEWNPLKEKLIINGGLRFEHNIQQIAASGTTAGVFFPIHVKLGKDSWLPSVNINYRPDSTWVLRTSYGRTVNRPEFREIAPFSDYDFVNREILNGNPLLKSAVIDNYDLRAELYPRRHANEVISLGVFYKHLTTPIERIRNDRAGGLNNEGDNFATIISYFNPDKAKVYGLEMELHKGLDFIPGNFFRKLSVVSNVTLIKSEVSRVYVPSSSIQYGSKAGAETGSFSGRPLQGQAPYIINAGLFYENPAWGTKFGFVYNVNGPSIYAIADGNADTILAVRQKQAPSNAEIGTLNIRPALIELSRQLLDFSFTQRLYKSLQMRLNILNILDAPYRIVEDQNWNYKYDKEVRVKPTQATDAAKGYYYFEGDNNYQKYKQGRYFTITLTYTL